MVLCRGKLLRFLASLALGALLLTSPGRSASAQAPLSLASRPVGLPVETPVPGDRTLRVAHAPAAERRALVYLHGMCGDERGADVWLPQATRYATLITLRADVPCPDRPGYKWPKDVRLIEARIERALALVQSERDGALDLERVALVGYSQGAHRAERLAAAFPRRYPLLALGGPPTAPSPLLLRHAGRVAVFGGGLEDTSHMVEGLLDVSSAGVVARYFDLPGTGHGGFGPKGPAVFEELLGWLYEEGATNSARRARGLARAGVSAPSREGVTAPLASSAAQGATSSGAL